MDKNLKVKVVYRNRKLEPTSEKTYSLREYTDMLKANMLSVISSVEDLAYIANDNKSQDEWSDETWALFQRIRHKQLDIAGSVERLSETIVTEDESCRALNG